MKIWDCFPSKYVASEDLKGQDVTVTIADVRVEELRSEKGTERKPVVYFAGMTKGLVLNVANTETIVSMLTDDTDLWIGRAITLFPTQTNFGKKVVPCIRVRDAPADAGIATSPAVTQQQVPQAVQQPVQQPAQTPTHQPPADGGPVQF